MSENMMNSSHKGTNVKSREGWDLTFGKPGQLDRCITCDENPKHGGGCEKICEGEGHD